jgi:hypothetical protein
MKMNRKTKKSATLDPILHFGSPNHELSFKLSFLVQTNWFPSKLMPYTLNHNLICLGLRPSSKGLGTNLKLLINKNAQFHWTLLLRPLFKMTLIISGDVLVDTYEGY